MHIMEVKEVRIRRMERTIDPAMEEQRQGITRDPSRIETGENGGTPMKQDHGETKGKATEEMSSQMMEIHPGTTPMETGTTVEAEDMIVDEETHDITSTITYKYATYAHES